MKAKKFLSMLTAGLLLLGAQAVDAADDSRARVMNEFDRMLAKSAPTVEIVRDGIKFTESVLPFDGGLLISNFGSETMNPRDDENAGYVIYRKGGEIFRLIEGLHKPTGMAVKDKHLFVCDGDRLKVFRFETLTDRIETTPREIKFADDDKVVNALALDGNTLYVSITNSDRIYSIDVSEPARPSEPKLFVELPGPNGMAVRDGALYVVTIPHDYASFQSDNVIYRVRNLSKPRVERLDEMPGLYDGAALSDDGRTLYVSDWLTSSVQAIDLKTRERKIIWREAGCGLADIAQAGGVLCIPDLINSRVIEIRVEK